MKRFFSLLAVPVAAFSMLCLTPQTATAQVDVGLELSLLVDVSGSVSATEFALQRTGYVNAFNSAAVQTAITNTPGGIAVNLVYWSSGGQQQQAVGWTHITNAAEATAFATAVGAAARPFNGNTAPGSAINFATPLFSSNNFNAPRQVIDVSGDGAQNDGADTSDARDAALAAGIDTINGLVILGETGVQAFYQNNIVGGTNAFLEVANDFADFGAAVERKLEREIINVIPVPGSLVMLGTGIVSLVGYSRRRKVAVA